MSVNVERLRAELEFITANPEQWEQEEIAVRREGCSTACCVAGWTVIHAGYEPRWRENYPWADTTTDGASMWPLAQGLLGLTEFEAELLFATDNDLADLWKIASDLTNGAIQIPASPTEEAAS